MGVWFFIEVAAVCAGNGLLERVVWALRGLSSPCGGSAAPPRGGGETEEQVLKSQSIPSQLRARKREEWGVVARGLLPDKEAGRGEKGFPERGAMEVGAEPMRLI